MSGRIIQIATFDIRPGRLTALKDRIRNAAAFGEKHGPQLLAGVRIDEAHMRACSCQMQRDPHAILDHGRMSEPDMREVMENCTMTALEIDAPPGGEGLEAILPMSRNGVMSSVTPRFVGIDHFVA